MTKKQVITNEFRRINQSTFLKIAVFAVACLPLIYAGLYLWAFWDPYARIDQLHVAVVNEDKGGYHDEKYQNIGQELVDKLKDDQTMAWTFVDRQTAMNGIESKKYVAAVIVPDDLTKTVLTIDSTNPRKGKITFVARDATNMLATKISDRVFLEMKINLNESVTKEIVAKIFFRIRDIRDSLDDAVVGTTDLVDGLTKLTDGSRTLHSGLIDIYTGTRDVDNGLGTLETNNDKLVQGSHDAATASATIRDNLSTASAGSLALVGGLTQVSGGLSSLAGGIIQAASGSSQLYIGSQTVLNGLTQTASGAALVVQGTSGTVALLKQFQADHPDLASDSGLLNILAVAEQTASGAGQVKTGLDKIIPGTTLVATGLGQLSQQLTMAQSGSQALMAGANQSLVGSQSLNSGVAALSAGATTLANGASSLEIGVHDYTDGVSKVKDGSHELLNGTDKVQSGSQELTDNLITAKDGSVELWNKLRDGYQELANQTTDTQINRKKPVIASPIDSSLVNFGEVANYGTGFTPYFIPLALWVGAMAIFFIVWPIEVGAGSLWQAIKVVWSKLVSASVIGLLQSMLLVGVLTIGLGLKVRYLTLFILFVLLISLVAVTLIQCFTAMWGEAAKFVAIVLLMLQLTSSSGTYPVETSAPFFTVIGRYLPMTYEVSGLREIISGDNLRLVAHDVLILISIVVGAFLLTCLTRRHWKQPSVLGNHT